MLYRSLLYGVERLRVSNERNHFRSFCDQIDDAKMPKAAQLMLASMLGS